MRNLTMALSLGTLLVGSFLTASHAQANPRGWKCDFSRLTVGYRRYGGRQITYSCYGRTLRGTRARARRACRGIHGCVTGACVPLDYRPRPYCERLP